jgi:acyl-CoA:acyl-CoA alkyltransferase
VARARIAAVSAHLPAGRVATADVERRLLASSAPGAVRPGLVERVTGVRFRHVAAPGENASDLAAAAAAKVLAATGLTAADVDLLVFASASQDMVEPATAHITGALLGTRCPALDVKDACNSFLQGVGVAEAMIAAGRHRRVLVVTGETPSRAVRWELTSREQFVESLPGYTLSDGGAAMVLEAGDAPGVEHVSFAADSSAWRVGTLPGGGSAHPRDPEAGYFRFDPAHLRRAFEAVGPGPFLDAMAGLGLGWDDCAAVCLHQVAVGHAGLVARRCGIPERLLVPVVADHGNLASASLPFQLARAIESGRVGPGDRVALVGLAGGISLGLVVVTL